MSKLVYIAGPLFSQAERDYLEKMVEKLAKASELDPIEDFFLPHRDYPDGSPRKEIFNADMDALSEARIVVGWLDTIDGGTCVELGYAYSYCNQIFALGVASCSEDLMIWGVCEKGKTLFHNLDDLAEAFGKYVKEAK